MSTHRGAVRSFDLGGARSLGRRWAARCSCGAVGTSAVWREALTFLTHHLEITARLRATWLANHPSPDLRGEYWLPVVYAYNNGHGRASAPQVLRRRVARLVSSLVRVVVGGVQSCATRT
jgi:hypothetical protein